MDLEAFWAIIDRSLVGNEHDAENDWEHEQSLRLQLAPLPPEELVAFHEIFHALADRADRQDVWGAGYTLDGGMGDDSFVYFRYWLVSRGRAVYESVLADPDSLADVPGLTVHGAHSAEGIAGVALDLHREIHEREPADADWKHYHALVEASVPPAERARRESPIAEDYDWQGDEDQRYPRLMALLDAQGVPPLFVSRSTFSLAAASDAVRLSDSAATVVFEPVYELHLKPTLVGLRVREMTSQEARSLSISSDQGRCFLVVSQHFRGHVIADELRIDERPSG